MNSLPSFIQFPPLDGHLLKTSGLGKAVMLLYRHPKEIKRNREKAGKLISKCQHSNNYCIIMTKPLFPLDMWARPVFGLTSDFKALSRDEREERDWAHLSQAARRRLRYSRLIAINTMWSLSLSFTHIHTQLWQW